jgi:hypothetical protein
MKMQRLKMVDNKNLKKFISVIVIIAFIFQIDLFLCPQSQDELARKFHKARNAYINGQYISSRNSIERIIGIIKEKGLERKEILGECYLLLGAIYEKEDKPILAEENYRKAKKEYGTQSVKGVNLEDLEIYRRIVQEKEPQTKGKIEKEKKRIRKKKFPWLLVAIGVVAVGVLVYFLLIKPKKKYQLTVSRGEGVNGNPESGTYPYKKGTKVSYNYTAQDGYSDLEVLLDGRKVPESNTFKVEGNHILRATATPNVVKPVTDADQNRLEINEGSTAILNVKLSAQPKNNLNVTVTRLSGDNDIRIVSGASLTFTPSNWNIFQPVTLQAAEDVDIKDGEATILISTSDPDVEKEVIIAKEIDNDRLDFVTKPDNLSIVEGGTGAFQVRLSAEPSSNSNVITTISRVSGDSDITVQSGSTLTFTPANWHTYRTVILEASEDSDTENGEAIIRISASGLPDKDITAVEIDNDSLNFVTDTDDVSIAEGGTVAFQVKLSAQPSSDVTATVSRISGDSDITVQSGSTLTFAPDEWQTYKTVTLKASEDPDVINGEATIRISAPGIPDKAIKAGEIDNDSLTFVTDTEEVSIPEGGTAAFKVKLSAQPSSDVTATISRVNGDSDITVQSGSTLTFTASNWDTDQTVTLEAFEDLDAKNGKATIRINATGIPDKDIKAIEIENDSLNFDTDTDEVSIPEGGTAAFQVKLSAQPSSDVTATISRVSGDSDITVQSGSTLTFTAANWDIYQTVTLEASEDMDAENGEAAIRISSPGIPDKDIKAIEIENDSLNFDTDTDEVSIPEGGTAAFKVKLSAQPSSDVTVTISWVSGDSDIAVQSGSTLTFTAANWDAYQTVTLEASEDSDTVDGDATIRISASGIPDKDIIASEIDNDNPNP